MKSWDCGGPGRGEVGVAVAVGYGRRRVKGSIAGRRCGNLCPVPWVQSYRFLAAAGRYSAVLTTDVHKGLDRTAPRHHRHAEHESVPSPVPQSMTHRVLTHNLSTSVSTSLPPHRRVPQQHRSYHCNQAPANCPSLWCRSPRPGSVLSQSCPPARPPPPSPRTCPPICR